MKMTIGYRMSCSKCLDSVYDGLYHHDGICFICKKPVCDEHKAMDFICTECWSKASPESKIELKKLSVAATRVSFIQRGLSYNSLIKSWFLLEIA